jgi:hypothetical protein
MFRCQTVIIGPKNSFYEKKIILHIQYITLAPKPTQDIFPLPTVSILLVVADKSKIFLCYTLTDSVKQPACTLRVKYELI